MKSGTARNPLVAAFVAGLLLGSITLPASAAVLLIDDFSTLQGPLSVTPSPLVGSQTDSSSAAGGGIVGGGRDMVLTTDPGSSPFSSYAQVAAGVAQLADNTQFSSDLLFQWDGTDGDPIIIDVDGLGSLDLTDGGNNNAFEIGLAFDDLPATLKMTVYSPDGSSSEVTFPGTGLIFTSISIFVPYDLFSGSADFSDIGAIELLISSPLNGLDLSLDFIQTGITPVPLPGAFWLLSSAFVGLMLTRRH